MKLSNLLKKEDKKKTLYLGSKAIVTVMEKDIKEDGYIKFCQYGSGCFSKSYFITSEEERYYCEWHLENLPDFDCHLPIAIEYNDSMIHTIIYNYNPYSKLISKYIEHYDEKGYKIQEKFYYEENQEIAAGTYYPLIPDEISYTGKDSSINDISFIFNPIIHNNLYHYLSQNFSDLIEIQNINNRLLIKGNELAVFFEHYGINLERWNTLSPEDIKIIRILSYSQNYEGMFKSLGIENIFEVSKEKIDLLKMLII